MNTIAIGDIHGCSLQLSNLLSSIRKLAFDQVVFLGDYVDVGKDSFGVIELLIAFKKEFPTTKFLKGNHEVSLLNYFYEGNFAEYAQKGGLPTIRSYCGKVSGDVHSCFVDRLPKHHLEFLEQLELYYEQDDTFFSHAGFDPHYPKIRTVEALVGTSHNPEGFVDGVDGKTLVCGHYFQENGMPRISDNFVAVDTGCGVIGGPLTAIQLPSRKIVQSFPATSDV